MSRSPKGTDALKVPIATVLEQLPRGAVRLPFRELKRYAQPGTFVGGCELDEALVELPLVEILPRLKQGQLARRPVQKQLSVSENVPAIFGSRTSPLPKNQTVHLGPPDSRLRDEHAASRILSDRTARPPASAPAPTTSPAPIAAPRLPIPSPAPLDGIRIPAVNFPTAAPPKAPVPPRPSAPQASPTSKPTTVSVALTDLAKPWPEAVRREVLAVQPAATAHIPFPDLETAMKRGKALFSWGKIRSWIGPKPCNDFPELDPTDLELPLDVLTPLFLAHRSPGKAGKKVVASSEIPDVFALKKSEPAPAEAKLEPAPAPAPMKAPEPAPALTLENRIRAGLASALAPSPAPEVPVPQAPAISGKALPQAKPGALPREVIQQACQLSGVSGALLADLEGQPIASQLPAGINAETAAAFLPEVCRHTNQLAQALNLPKPVQIELLLGKIPLQILSTNRAHLAVLGKPSETLPKLQLASLANQLAQRNP